MSSSHLAKSVVILVCVSMAAPITNFANTVSDGQHCVRIIDELLTWDDRRADVSRLCIVLCSYIYVRIPAFVYACVPP